MVKRRTQGVGINSIKRKDLSKVNFSSVEGKVAIVTVCAAIPVDGALSAGHQN